METSISDQLHARLVAVLGGDSNRVLVEQGPLEPYGRDFSYVEGKAPPRTVAFPKTAAEISQLLAVATSFGVPVTPRGAGLGLGTTMSVEFGIVVDCSLMDRIVSIDKETETVVVEPGVTFKTLSRVLASKGFAVSVPDAPPTASVLANHLNFGAGGYVTRHGLGPDLVVGLEVVLPDGSIVRTGTGMAMGVEFFGRYAASPIPDLTGLFLGSLGTLGVVTQLAIRIFPRPATVAHRKFGFADMAMASHAVQAVVRRQLADQVTVYSWFFLAEATARLADRIDGKPLDEASMRSLRDEVRHLPEVYAFFSIHGDQRGPQERLVELHELLTQDFEGQAMDMSADETAKCNHIAMGEPHEFSKRALLGRKGRYQGAFGNYSTYAPMSAWSALYEAWGRIGAQFGHPVTIYAKLMPRGRFSIFGFFLSYYDQDDPVDRKRIADLCRALDAATCRLGGIPAISMPGQLSQMSAYPLYLTIKRALDPHNIMRPTLAKPA